MTNFIIFEIVGWVGTLFYFYGYLRIALGINTTRKHYLTVNAVAALAITIVSVAKGTHPVVVLNLAWLAISIAGIRGARPRFIAISPRIFLAGGMAWVAAVAVAFMAGEQAYAVLMLAWLGTAVFILSYLLFVNEGISVIEFNICNVIAPIALLPRLYDDSNWPVLALELFWATIAVYAVASRRSATKVPFGDVKDS
jgi:hypothetical protein